MVVHTVILNSWEFVETCQNQIKCRLRNSGKQMQQLLLEALREGKLQSRKQGREHRFIVKIARQWECGELRK